MSGQKSKFKLVEMIQAISKNKKCRRHLSLSGDKSISHRALLISSLAEGKSEINNLSNSDDIKSTINCLDSLGIKCEHYNEKVIVFGKGYKGYQSPTKPIDAGNSGTTARLLSGILAIQNFDSVLTGDDSLSARPMKRVIEPLTEMGAKVKSNRADKLPLHFSVAENLRPMNYQMPIASAQVKSAILLAGLHLDE